MQLTIVYPDDLVVIDRVCQTIQLDPFNPPVNLHALQWSGKAGRIEYDDYTVDPIVELPQWALDVVDEFNRLRNINQDKLAEQERMQLAEGNGKARLERDRQRQIDRAKHYMKELSGHLQRQLAKDGRKALGRNARIQLVSLNRTIETLNEIAEDRVMARFTYNTATPMGQLTSESVNDLKTALAKVTRAAESITLMSEEQMTTDVGVPTTDQAGFKSSLNQLKTALEAAPFSNILPNLDQG